jgi:hypothetical protein
VRNQIQSPTRRADVDGAFIAPAVGYHLQSEQGQMVLGKPDVVVITCQIGHDAWNRSGANFDALHAAGVRVICRLSHGEFPLGTLPFSQSYGAFSRRCANFVAASSGCHTWIIGNEPNFRYNWPTVLAGDDDHELSGVSSESFAPPDVSRGKSGEPEGAPEKSQSWLQRVKDLLGVGGLRQLGLGAGGKAGLALALPLDLRYTGPARFSGLISQPVAERGNRIGGIVFRHPKLLRHEVRRHRIAQVNPAIQHNPQSIDQFFNPLGLRDEAGRPGLRAAA